MGKGYMRFWDTYITDLPKFRTKCKGYGCNQALHSFCLVPCIFLPAGPRSVCGSFGVYYVSFLCFFIPCKMSVDNNYSRDAENF
jgi:hypothetical protein